MTGSPPRAPARPVPVEAARGLAGEIEAAAAEIEAERRLPQWLVDKLWQAGLFSMLVPRSCGGLELDLPTYVRVIEELARSDASVAWCIGQGSGLCLTAAYLEPDTAREIFEETRPATLANGPGERNEPACAVPVEGGYRVTGRWNFGSGIRHATWLIGFSQVSGEEFQRFMLFPIHQAELIDTWQVSGLRGTGSFSFKVSDLFVPTSHSVVVSTRTRREQGPLYLFSSSGVFGPSFGSVALGIAHSALGSFVDMASGKTPRGLGRTVRESEVVQSMVARSHARLNGARLLLHDTLRDVWDEVSSAGRITTEQRIRVRLAATNATHEAASVVDAVFQAAGSTAIFATQPFERRFRDMHAVTQQLQARAAHFETVGRFLLGLEPDTQFL